jgi:hypothetical protein
MLDANYAQSIKIVFWLSMMRVFRRGSASNWREPRGPRGQSRKEEVFGDGEKGPDTSVLAGSMN